MPDESPQVAEARPSDAPLPLTERLKRYQTEVESIVSGGVEHPKCEFKRSVSIGRDRLPDRLDFVKLIQGLANAHLGEERFIIIGADQKEKRFYALQNHAELDPAKVNQIVSKHLTPQPVFEVFNSLQSSTGDPYVLIVLAASQPRPILASTEGQSDQRLHFRLGDTWIKNNTGLQPASRADLDLMYAEQIRRQVDEESENRARRRFAHFREEFSVPTAPLTNMRPSPELLVGPREQLRTFVEQVFSDGNATSFNMLLEMARDRLVSGWDTHIPVGSRLSSDIDAWIEEVGGFYKDEFVPALESLTETGLLVVKYRADLVLCTAVVDQLVETFNGSRGLTYLKASALNSKANSLPFWRPAFDAYIGIRALAAYAVHRSRFDYLSVMLPRYVRKFTVDDQSRAKEPLLFWPFSGHIGMPAMQEGRTNALWEERIRGAWPSYFGSYEAYLAAALQLEFILDFNSYVHINGAEPTITKFAESIPRVSFNYLPDFWTNRLNPVVPIAEYLYDRLETDDEYPFYLAIERNVMNAFFANKSPEQKLILLGGYLSQLEEWQDKVMMQQHRFPFMFEWPEKLKAIVELYKLNRRTESPGNR